MTSTGPNIENLTLNVTEEIHVRAPLDVTFAALLEQIGPENDTLEGKPMPLRLEPWPGGRWYRALFILPATAQQQRADGDGDDQFIVQHW